MDYSRENGYICEYDNYPVPQFRKTISEEERKKLEARKAEFLARLEAERIERMNRSA